MFDEMQQFLIKMASRLKKMENIQLDEGYFLPHHVK